MGNFKETDAYRNAVNSFMEFRKENPSKIIQLSLLSEICRKYGFCSDPLLEYLNAEFNKKLEKHKFDVNFENPGLHQDIAPEDIPHFATYINAFDELMSYDASLEEIFDYGYESGTNYWGVGIVRK